MDDCKNKREWSMEECRALGFEIDGDVLRKYQGSDVDVTIPDFVKTIGRQAFFKNQTMCSVHLPTGLVKIEKEAFYHCESLSEIVIPASVREIKGGSFSFCKNLTDVFFESLDFKAEMSCFQGSLKGASVVIPEGVESIPENLFFSAELVSVTIPQSVKKIGDSAFFSCKNLESVYYEGTLLDWCLISFEKAANPLSFAKKFYVQGKEITEVVIPEEIVDLSPRAFQGFCGMKKLTLSPKMGIVRPFSFSKCRALKEVDIPFGVAAIGDGAFAYCDDLEGLVFPDSLAVIGSSIIKDCNKLKELTIPENVRVVGEHAFEYLVSLEKLTMSFTTSLKDPSMKDLGSYPLGYFFGDLNNIPAGPKVNQEYYSVIKGKKDSILAAFPLAFKEVVVTKGAIPCGAFYKCDFLTKITLSERVDKIGEEAFLGCSGLREIVIPEGVTEIPNGAFRDCAQLERIKFPSTLKKIEGIAFYGCKALKELVIPASVQTIKESAFTGCESLERIVVDKKNKVYHSVGDCLIETATRKLIKGGNHCSIPADGSVTEIADHAFDLNDKIEYIEIPPTVRSIGYRAFFHCDNLKTVRFLGSGFKWLFVKKGVFWKEDSVELKVVCGKKK